MTKIRGACTLSIKRGEIKTEDRDRDSAGKRYRGARTYLFDIGSSEFGNTEEEED